MLAQSEIDRLVRLVMAVARGMGQFADDDVERVYRWAQRIRIEAAILDLVLSGTLVVSVPPGDGDPQFALPR